MSLSTMIRAQRGYLRNIYTNVTYPFQFNPTELSDSKQVTWGKREGVATQQEKGASGQVGAASAASPEYKTPAERIGRRFSKADFRKFDAEGDRTISFNFTIDGREKMPDEPDWRRNADGDILSDLAFLRSLVYPKAGTNLQELLTITSSQGASSFAEEWFNQPPTVILALGDLTMEGYVSNLQINETLFNAKLNPVRATVTINLIEQVDSFTFVMDAVNRLRRAAHRGNL